MSFYGELPDSYNLVVNPNHKLVLKVHDDLKADKGDKLAENDAERKKLREEIEFMEKEHNNKKADEISQLEKDDLEKLRKELEGIEKTRRDMLEEWGAGNNVVKQVIDLALLANNMLRGEELSTFVKRSVDLL
jgi:molecular chaperone HtpG